jgi:N-acetylmuramoyl-L-alanine amidase
VSPTTDEIIARRKRKRSRRRTTRIVVICLVAALVIAAAAFAIVELSRLGRGHKSDGSVAAASPTPTPAAAGAVTPAAAGTPAITPTAAPSASTSASSTGGAKASPGPSASPGTPVVLGAPAPRPHIVKDYIRFGARRRAEMQSYALRHYGIDRATLHPKVIVLHYTAGSDYASAHNLFNTDTPNMGVLPGTVAHFVVDKDGTIYQQLPLDVMGRHTVGLNYVAIGIEVVQEARSSDAQAIAQIMARGPQRRALVSLVRYLMGRYQIPVKNVLGHGTANGSPYFRDKLGWTNDHTDWQLPEVKLLRARLSGH